PRRLGLRLSFCRLLLDRGDLRLALAVRLLNVAGADPPPDSRHRHVAVLAAEAHGALELGAGGVVLLLEHAPALGAAQRHARVGGRVLLVGDLALLAFPGLPRVRLRIVAHADALRLARHAGRHAGDLGGHFPKLALCGARRGGENGGQRGQQAGGRKADDGDCFHGLSLRRRECTLAAPFRAPDSTSFSPWPHSPPHTPRTPRPTACSPWSPRWRGRRGRT